MEKKKGFFKKLFDKADKKLEKKAENKDDECRSCCDCK